MTSALNCYIFYPEKTKILIWQDFDESLKMLDNWKKNTSKEHFLAEQTYAGLKSLLLTHKAFAKQWFGKFKAYIKGSYLSLTRFSSQHCELDFSQARSEDMDKIGRYKGGLANLLMRFMAHNMILDYL